MKLFDRINGALYEEELQREQTEEMDDLPEKVQWKKPPRIAVSDVALVFSIVSLIFVIVNSLVR